MPDPTVTVSCRNGDFSFDPETVTMTAAGNIVFQRAAGSDWQFTGFSSSNCSDFSVVNSLPAPTMTVRDDFRDTDRTCNYTVTISTGDESDPQIINRGG